MISGVHKGINFQKLHQGGSKTLTGYLYFVQNINYDTDYDSEQFYSYMSLHTSVS